MAHQQRGQFMKPRELVEDVIRRQTDGTLTFRIEEDDYTIGAITEVNGKIARGAWSKHALAMDCQAADIGLREILRRLDEAQRA